MGRTFLHSASEFKSAACVRDMLAELDKLLPDVTLQLLTARDKYGWSVLHRAARNEKHDDTIKFLLEFILQKYQQTGE